MTNHVAVAPAWTCVGCDKEWPCPTRREELRAEYRGALPSLAIYLGRYFLQAAEDLQHVPAGWLHNRFVGWIHRLDPNRSSNAVRMLLDAQELAFSHVPDNHGRCRVCGDPADCWVGLRD
nr:hypothetical protein [Micromonospora sp. DSM 115978]